MVDLRAILDQRQGSPQEPVAQKAYDACPSQRKACGFISVLGAHTATVTTKDDKSIHAGQRVCEWLFPT